MKRSLSRPQFIPVVIPVPPLKRGTICDSRSSSPSSPPSPRDARFLDLRVLRPVFPLCFPSTREIVVCFFLPPFPPLMTCKCPRTTGNDHYMLLSDESVRGGVHLPFSPFFPVLQVLRVRDAFLCTPHILPVPYLSLLLLLCPRSQCVNLSYRSALLSLFFEMFRKVGESFDAAYTDFSRPIYPFILQYLSLEDSFVG